jgi:hypothetical protein
MRSVGERDHNGRRNVSALHQTIYTCFLFHLPRENSRRVNSPTAVSEHPQNTPECSLSTLRPNAYALRASLLRSASANRRRRPPRRPFSNRFSLRYSDRLDLLAIDPASKQRRKELQRLDGAKH